MSTNRRASKRGKKPNPDNELTEVIVMRVSPATLAQLREIADGQTIPIGTAARQSVMRDLATLARKVAA